MVTFIKTFTLENIKFKLLILYLLNVTDIIFTLLLLSTDLYMEANLLMANAVQSLLASFLLKIALPALLLFYLYIRIKKASEAQLRQSNIIFNIATGVYVAINFSHLIWCSLFILHLL